MQRAAQLNVEIALKRHRIVAILGPRQCGKTTLARRIAQNYGKSVTFYDFENPKDITRLQNPMMALEEKKGLVVIDEIQRRPDLFSVLRVLADESEDRKFLILGSASRELIRQSSETLAGRISYIELTPFNLREVDDLKRLWVQGGFPRSYLESSQDSGDWRRAYITTFLEQDIPLLGIGIPPAALRRFWTMLAHCHGGILNLSELGSSFGASHTTMRSYIDILSGTFMIRQLQPWWENIKKRQVKTPKVYFRDSGLFHSLIGIEDWETLDSHPKLGASWEGFALEEIIRHHNADQGECYFWGTHGGAELDLMILKRGKRIGFEFKYDENPKISKSMVIAKDELGLSELWVVVPSGEDAPIADGIRVTGLKHYLLK